MTTATTTNKNNNNNNVYYFYEHPNNDFIGWLMKGGDFEPEDPTLCPCPKCRRKNETLNFFGRVWHVIKVRIFLHNHRENDFHFECVNGNNFYRCFSIAGGDSEN